MAQEGLDLERGGLAGVFEFRGYEVADTMGGEPLDARTFAQAVKQRDNPPGVFV